MKTIVLRADAGGDMGTGHLMRCLALAQAWRDAGGQAVFITACRNRKLTSLLEKECAPVYLLPFVYPDAGDWQETGRIMAGNGAGWLVLDGYRFDLIYQRRAKETGCKLLAIDDLAHLDHYYADFILNQNLGADGLHYRCEPGSKLLLGTSYALLRREFHEAVRPGHRTLKVVRKMLVTMGGSDPANRTAEVLRILADSEISGLDITVVAGADNPRIGELEALAGKSRHDIRVVPSAESMAQLMSEADLAISAAGSTVWELACLGVPMLLSAIAGNQKLIYESAVASRIALPFSAANLNRLLGDAALREDMSGRGRRLVDGRGARRVAGIMMGEE